MTNIYHQHAAAFSNVSAYAVVDAKGDRIASIAFKFPRDGAGRLYVYLHIFGIGMVRGFADGWGYDKRSASVANASRAALAAMVEKDQTVPPYAKTIADVKAICAALSEGHGGHDWQHELTEAGYRVYGAV